MKNKTYKTILLCSAIALWGTATAPAVSGFQGSIPLDFRLSPLVGQSVETFPKAEMAEITAVTTRQENGAVSVLVEATDTIQYTAFKLSAPSRLILDLPRMRGGALTAPMEVNQGVVKSLRPMYFKEAEVLRLEFALNQSVPYEITKPEKNKLLIKWQPSSQENAPQTLAKAAIEPTAAVRTPVQTSSGTPPETAASEGTGDSCDTIMLGKKEKISLDFQLANLRNVLRIISEVGEFNLVISPEVEGAVTTKLNNVPWNMGLDTILKNNALGRQCFGNIMRIASQTTIANEEQARTSAEAARASANQAKELQQDLFTEVVRINYANITELNQNLAGLVSPRGKVTIDPRTNTIIMTDIRPRLNRMLSLIKSLDIVSPQVMIEARIVEVNKNFTQELGIQWGGRISRVTPNDFPNTISLGASTLTSPGFVVDLPTTAVPAAGLGLTLGSLAGDTLLDIQLSALESQGKGRVLSSPKVTTLNNRQAKIQSGRRIPFQTVSQDGTQTQFVDASINLVVTPHITTDNNIFMNILAQKNAADFSMSVNGVPSITTKEAATEVMVKNGATTVLGGLYESTVNEARTQVPLFSKLPILGRLFQRTQETDLINELLIFITPTIVINIDPLAP